MRFQSGQLFKLGERCLLAVSFTLLVLFALSFVFLDWNWRGTVNIPGHSLQLMIELSNGEGTWSAYFYRQER